MAAYSIDLLPKKKWFRGFFRATFQNKELFQSSESAQWLTYKLRSNLINMPDTLQNGLKSKLEHKHVFTYSFMGTTYFIWAPLASGKNVIHPPPL